MKPFRVLNKPIAEILDTKEDTYLVKVVKYIPTEIVAAYTAARALLLEDVSTLSKGQLPYGEKEDYFLYTFIFFGCLLLIPLYKYYALRDKNLPVPFYQITISLLAFAIWVFAFGDFFEINYSWYSHKLASLTLIFFTLITPLLERVFVKNNKSITYKL